MADQLDTFNKSNLDLENIEVSIDDEDQTMLLLCFLPKSHAHSKYTWGLLGKCTDNVEVLKRPNPRGLPPSKTKYVQCIKTIKGEGV